MPIKFNLGFSEILGFGILLTIAASGISAHAAAKSETSACTAPNFDQPDSKISVKGGIEISYLKEHQNVGRFCCADRGWFEVKNVEHPAAATKITADIRKQMSVGRKLKASNCDYNDAENAGSDEPDTNEFFNAATVTFVSDHLLGAETTVHFGGAHHSGSTMLDCVIYQMDNGQKIELRKSLNAAGKKWVASLMCESAKRAKAENQKELCQSYQSVIDQLVAPGVRFCMVKEGIVVRASAPALTMDQNSIQANEISKYFDLSPELKSEIEKSLSSRSELGGQQGKSK